MSDEQRPISKELVRQAAREALAEMRAHLTPEMCAELVKRCREKWGHLNEAK